MKMKTIITFGFLFLLNVLFFLSCSTVTYEKIYPTLQDGKYDSEFPYKGSSEELENLSETVQRINSTAFYKTYTLDHSNPQTLTELQSKGIEGFIVERGYANRSGAGTGTVIYSAIGKVVLLTCAHIVNYPDTVISYVSDEEGSKTEFVESIFIKEKQSIYVAGFPEGSELFILAMDDKQDIALIGRKYRTLRSFKLPVFDYPIGNAMELEWGSFVYVFGYPFNYQMVTKGIVSISDRDEHGSFLIDAVVNKGSSGAIVLAIRDGVPNFELVGIVRRVPGEEENIIVPKKLKDNDAYNPIIPYTGEEYVKRFSSIRYGIAKVISAEAIIEFIENELENLRGEGYYMKSFLLSN